MSVKTATNNQSLIDEIDFSKYRSRELTDRITDLVSIPRNASFLASTIFVCVVITAIVIYTLLKYDNQEFFTIAISETYGFFASIVFSLALWLILMIRKSLTSLTAIVAILLESTANIVADYRSIAQGEKKMPPVNDLIAAVYENVFVFVFKRVVENTTGFLGRPIFWVYKLTIDRMFRKVVRIALKRSITKREAADVKETIEAGMEVVTEDEATITKNLNWVRDKVTTSGNWLAIRIMFPCYLIVAAFLVVLWMPIVVLMWLI